MTTDKGILIRNIYYMLAYAFQELRQNNYVEIEGEAFDEIHDLFAEILIRGISFQLKQGLHKEYVARQETMPSIKGKIEMTETMAQKMMQKNLVACSYDELSEDNIFNQIIVTTVQVLLKQSSVKKEKKAKLKQLMLFFSNVKSVTIGSIHWNMLRFDRNNRSYRMLLYVCYFILDGMLMTTEDGHFKMRELSDDHMNRLFEKFVLEYYRKHFPQYKARAEQVKWNINKELSTVNILPIMQTDIMLTIGERTLIIDTKYYGRTMQTQFDKKSVHSNNLYQIHTYVTEHDTKRDGSVDGMLLYAKTQEVISPDGQMSMASGSTIYFRTLDLNQDFSEISNRLNSLIKTT